MNKKMAVLLLSIVATVATLAVAGSDPMVGGHEMSPSKNIIQNPVNSADPTPLVAAVKAAGLVETLQGAGPFTVFAPTNEAFAALPAGTVDTLLKPGNKSKLVAVLTYHVLPGKYHVLPGKHSAADIEADIKKMNGKAEYKTVEGDSLSFSDKDGA